MKKIEPTNNEKVKALDMAFLFAEPIVEKAGENGNAVKACQVPLDIDGEFK